MTRDILNALGQKIGELTLPDNTPEHIWTQKLALYQVNNAPKVIPPITPRQMRLQLFAMGITNAAVVSAIEAAIPDPDKTIALIEWEYAISFERSSPFVDAVGALLGLNSDQIDSMWLEAGQRT